MPQYILLPLTFNNFITTTLVMILITQFSGVNWYQIEKQLSPNASAILSIFIFLDVSSQLNVPTHISFKQD